MSDMLEAAVKSNDFLCSLINNMTAAVFVVDEEVRVQNINKSFSELFQKVEDDVRGQLCGNAIGCIFPVKEDVDCGETYACNTCELRKKLLEAFANKGEAQVAIINREFLIGDEFQSKNFHVITKYFNFEGINLVMVIVNDITPLEQQRRRLAALNELKNEFIGIAAHDLRNPITEIQSSASLLLKYGEQLGQKDTTRLLSSIKSSSGLLKSLLETLLDISKVEEGTVHINPKMNDYTIFMNECLLMNRLLAEEKSISLELMLQEGIPKFNFDMFKLRQVINYFINYAINIQDIGPKLEIKAMVENDKVITMLKSKDSKLPEFARKKLTKIFDNLAKDYKDDELGTGLGLLVSKHIIEKHGGELGINSLDGEEVIFYFTLPVRSDNRPSKSSS